MATYDERKREFVETLTGATMIGAPSARAFKFVAELAQELSGGKIELPSFPDVALRVRKVLADESVTVEKVARVVGSDPGLVARLLTLANSAALNRSGKAITELKTAVSRIGHNNVRTAAVSYAIAQLRHANELQHILKELEQLWKESTLVAALAYSLAVRRRDVNADEAMLAGLLHNVGKIYIFARASKHDALLGDPAARDEVLRGWHASVGKAIVENWGFPQRIAEAIGEHEHLDRTCMGTADLTDVLTVATVMSTFMECEADMELNMQGVRAFTRLGLDNEQCATILRNGKEEIAALRAALGE
jgi:putative nucleotidyltransferase with HDIG domain